MNFIRVIRAIRGPLLPSDSCPIRVHLSRRRLGEGGFVVTKQKRNEAPERIEPKRVRCGIGCSKAFGVRLSMFSERNKQKRPVRFSQTGRFELN